MVLLTILLLFLGSIFFAGYAVGRSSGRREGIVEERRRLGFVGGYGPPVQHGPVPADAHERSVPESAGRPSSPPRVIPPRPTPAAVPPSPTAVPQHAAAPFLLADPQERAREEERRRLRNVNITFAVSTLLLVAAATLFVGSFLPPMARVGGLVTVVLGLMAAGVLLHARSERLRPAALALAGSGLAMVPVLGILLDLELIHDPVISWLLTSTVGIGLTAVLAWRLRSPVVAHLAAAFVASTSMAGGAAFRAGLVWTLVAGLLLSIGLCWWLSRRREDDGLFVDALRRQHPWLGYGLPAVALFVAAAAPNAVLTWGELAMILVLAAVYAGSRSLSGEDHDWWDGPIVRAAGLGALMCLLAQWDVPGHAMVLVLGLAAVGFVVLLRLRRSAAAGSRPHVLAESGSWGVVAVASAASEPAVAEVGADGVLAVMILIAGALCGARLRQPQSLLAAAAAPTAVVAAMAVTRFTAGMWPVLQVGVVLGYGLALWLSRRLPATGTADGSVAPASRDGWQALLLSTVWIGATWLPWTWTSRIGDGSYTTLQLQWLLGLSGVLLATLALVFARWRVGARDDEGRVWVPLTAWGLWSAVAVLLTLPAEHLWASPWLVPLLVCLALMLAGGMRLLSILSAGSVPARTVLLVAAVLVALPSAVGSVHENWVVGVAALLGWAGLWLMLVRLAAEHVGRAVRMPAMLVVQALVSTAATRAADELGWGLSLVLLVLVLSLVLGATLRARTIGMGHRWDRVGLWCSGAAVVVVAVVALAEADRLAALSAALGIVVLGLLEGPEDIDGLPSMRTGAVLTGGLGAVVVLTDALTLTGGLLAEPMVPAYLAGPALAVVAAVVLLRRPTQADPDVSERADQGGAARRRRWTAGSLLAVGIVLTEVGLVRAGLNGVELGAFGALAAALPWVCAAVMVPTAARMLDGRSAAAATAPVLAWGLGRGVVHALVSTGLGERLPDDAAGPLVLVTGLVAALAVWAGVRRTVGPESHGALATAVTACLFTLVLPAPAWALWAAATLLVLGAWEGLRRAEPYVSATAVRVARCHMVTLVAILLLCLWFRLSPPASSVETATRAWWSVVALATVLAGVAVLDRTRGSRWVAAAVHTTAALATLGAGSTVLPGPGVTQLVSLLGFVIVLAAGLLVGDRVLLWWGAVGLLLSVMYALSDLFFLWLVLFAAGLFILGVRQLQRSERRGAGHRPEGGPEGHSHVPSAAGDRAHQDRRD